MRPAGAMRAATGWRRCETQPAGGDAKRNRSFGDAKSNAIFQPGHNEPRAQEISDTSSR
jgi:hypothetical protein